MTVAGALRLIWHAGAEHQAAVIFEFAVGRLDLAIGNATTGRASLQSEAADELWTKVKTKRDDGDFAPAAGGWRSA
jgi:hypothetical protein